MGAEGPERKAKAVGGQRVSSAYERLVALGQRMVDVIRRSKGRDNKTLGAMAEAIRNAIETSAKTIRHISWFEVVKTTGHVVEGKVAHFQVTLKIGFRIEDQ